MECVTGYYQVCLSFLQQQRLPVATHRTQAKWCNGDAGNMVLQQDGTAK